VTLAVIGEPVGEVLPRRLVVGVVDEVARLDFEALENAAVRRLAVERRRGVAIVRRQVVWRFEIERRREIADREAAVGLQIQGAFRGRAARRGRARVDYVAAAGRLHDFPVLGDGAVVPPDAGVLRDRHALEHPEVVLVAHLRRRIAA